MINGHPGGRSSEPIVAGDHNYSVDGMRPFGAAFF